MRVLICLLALMAVCFVPKARAETPGIPERQMLTTHIESHYPVQLTDPQKKKRRSYSQFGYGLSYFPIKLFNITQFIDPKDFGQHSYGQPSLSEKNGALYTCRGGFMDFSHIRVAADWTVYLTFKLLAEAEQNNLELEPEAGTLSLQFHNLDKLSLEDLVSLSQKIAYERLLWHEIASWHYHAPNHFISEQQSAFTPEDLYSNLLGTYIGRNIALRILMQREDLSYSEIATEEIAKMIASLQPLQEKNSCKRAYDQVDRHIQSQLPEDERNVDVWWDSQILFRDERYIFKRYMNYGPALSPWLIPQPEKLGCTCNIKPQVLQVPQTTSGGTSFYNYYTFSIVPDSLLFYHHRTGKQLHPTFPPFTTQYIGAVISVVRADMECRLMPGFDKRDLKDPVPSYADVRYVMF